MAVRTESHRVNLPHRRGEGKQLGAGLRVPDAHGLIPAAHQPLPIRAKLQAEDGAAVSFQNALRRAAEGIPKPNAAIGPTAGQQLAIGAISDL